MVYLVTTLATVLLMQEVPAPEAATANAAQSQTPPCAAEEFDAFDFWVGEWDVFRNGSDEKRADSRIERVSQGCAIRETWMPLQGGHGSSVTSLNPQTGVWHQLWVGAQPGEVHFYGGPVDGAMILTGYWGRNDDGVPNLVRMTYTLEGDGSVRQFGQSSNDHGRTWSDAFDLIYRRKSEGEEE